MNIVQTCIGELPEELREAALAIQRERRKVGNMFYPYLSDDCVKALEDEIMLTLWPMEHSFYFILTDIEHYVRFQNQNIRCLRRRQSLIFKIRSNGQTIYKK